MSSSESLCLTNVRVTGVDGTPGQGTPATGIVAGLRYFRKFQKNGVVRPAHVELTLTRNHIRYDANGSPINSTDTMRLEAWNNDNDDGGGKGIADHIAKWYSVGKAFSIINGRLRMYKRRVYLSDGSQVNNVDGSPVLVPATSLVVRSMSQLTPHNESKKTESREIANFNAGMTYKSFFSRPANWNSPAHPDNVAWRELISWRKAQKYDGTDYYGNAKVCIVSGATPADGFPLETRKIDGAGGVQAPAAAPAAAVQDVTAKFMGFTAEQQAIMLQILQGTEAVQTAQPVDTIPATAIQVETPF